MTRDDLEAAIWRRWPTHDPIAAEAVDAILTCVDAHVRHVAGITADRRAAISVTSATRKRDQRAAPRMRDNTLTHQIHLFFTGPGGNLIAVSCQCRKKTGGYEPIVTRARWDADEAQAVYRAHLDTAGQVKAHADATP